MITILMVSLLLQEQSTAAVTVRIVGDSEAPVVLVGNVCDPAGEEIVAQVSEDRRPGPLNFGPFQSAPFLCPGACDIAFRSRDGREIASVQVGTIRLRDKGRYYSLLSPPFPPRPFKGLNRALRICHGAYAFSVDVAPTMFAVEGALVYLAAATFSDGSTWQLADRTRFLKSISDAWRNSAR